MPHPEIQKQRVALLHAQASWAELEALVKLFEAAVLRGDADVADAGRDRLHAMLDAFLDLRAEANQVVRNLLGRG
jgi:hypothetical protein